MSIGDRLRRLEEVQGTPHYMVITYRYDPSMAEDEVDNPDVAGMRAEAALSSGRPVIWAERSASGDWPPRFGWVRPRALCSQWPDSKLNEAVRQLQQWVAA